MVAPIRVHRGAGGGEIGGWRGFGLGAGGGGLAGDGCGSFARLVLYVVFDGFFDQRSERCAVYGFALADIDGSAGASVEAGVE